MRGKVSLALLTFSAFQLAGAVSASAQTIQTVAGGGLYDDSPAIQVSLEGPDGVAYAPDGTVYVIDGARIEHLIPLSGLITTVAGTGTSGYSGDGGSATSAELSDPGGVAVDGAGNLYISDETNAVIRKVTAATGVITTVAGNGTLGFSGDGGQAKSAALSPAGIAVDGAGNLYIADSGNQRIRKVSAATGIITTVAGNGTLGLSGDGGPATSAAFSFPVGVAVDGAGNLYIADTVNQRIRMVSATTGIISTVAGNGIEGYSGDGGPGAGAELSGPSGVAVDGAGNLYIADTYNSVIRKVTAATGIINTVAGNGTLGFSGDGGPATSAELAGAFGVAATPSGNLYIADTDNQRVRLVSATTRVVTTVAGNGDYGYFSGDGGPATSADLDTAVGVALDGAGNLYISDEQNSRIRKVNAQTGVITTVAGDGSFGYSGDGGPATSAELSDPGGVAVDGAGNLYIADSGNQRIRKVSAMTGIITSVAGNGTRGYSGDGGPATSAELSDPVDVAVDGTGNLYVTDLGNSRIRKVSAASGVITTVAGNGTYGYAGDGGPAASAEISDPFGVAVDGTGNLYIADSGNSVIRKVTAATGIISTVAGNGTHGYSGNGGPATSAELSGPMGVAVDGTGSLYIADSGNSVIRKFTAATGIISTVAGNGTYGYSGNDVPATSAELSDPFGVAVSSGGNLYIADSENNLVREVTGLAASAQTITFGAIATQAAGTQLALQASASSGLPVTFMSSTASVCTISGSTASLLTTGTCKITASQTGNANFAPATPVSQSFSVLTGATVTLGNASGTQVYPTWNNFAIGPSYTGSPVPTGTVTLYDNGIAIVTLALGGNGVAYYTAQPLNAGVNVITASYSGDSHYAPEVSAPETITVTPAPVQLTASCWGGTPWEVAYQCTVNVSAATSTPPTGSISYSLDGAAATAVALSNGNASFTVPTLPVSGAHKLTIAYAGQGNYAAATTLTESFTTAPGQTQLLIISSSYYLTAGSTITLTVTASTPQSGVPPGSVAFYDNGAALGSAPIGSNGVATYPVASVPKGTNTYTAKYAATANYAAATSDSATVTAH